MRAAKAWYLLYFASLSCIFPFLNLFLARVSRLSPQQIGIIGCARPLISFPAGSLWSGLADTSRRHRALLCFTLAASILLRLCITAVARAGFAPLLAVVVAAEAFAAPVTIIVDAAVMAACAQQADYGKQRLWGAIGWGSMAAVAGTTIAHAGLWAAFAEHAALATLVFWPTLKLPFGPLHAKLAERSGHPHSDASGSSEPQLAKQQAATAAVAAGGQDGPAFEGVHRFDSALEAQSLLHSGDSSKLKPPDDRGGGGGGTEPPLEQQQPQPRVRFWAGVCQLLGRPEAAIFLAQALVMGFGVGNIEGFLFLYLDELGASELLMGLSLSVTCAAEALVFYFLPQILSAIGIRRCMHLVFAAFLLRMGCYTALRWAPSPWLVLPAELLHGCTFALAWGGGTAYCAELSPPGLEATTQGLFQGLYFGLGVGTGALVGGTVYDRHGAQAVYIVACAVLAAGWAATSAAQLAAALMGARPARYRYLQSAAVELGEAPSGSRG